MKILYKKTAFYVAVISGMVVLLFLMAHAQEKLLQLENLGPSKPYVFRLTLYALLFGILLEWRGLKRALKRNFKINYLVVPMVITGGLSFFPHHQWYILYGLGNDGWLILIYPLRFVSIHVVLAIITGVLLIRSFTR
jgi:hypothetical protein